MNIKYPRVKRVKLICKEDRNSHYSGNPAFEMGSYPSKKNNSSVMEVSNDGCDWLII